MLSKGSVLLGVTREQRCCTVTTHLHAHVHRTAIYQVHLLNCFLTQMHWVATDWLINLDFCCNIQMAESALNPNNVKEWIHPAFYQHLRLVVVVSWCSWYFLGTFWGLGTNWSLLPQYLYWVCPSLYGSVTIMWLLLPGHIEPQRSKLIQYISLWWC